MYKYDISINTDNPVPSNTMSLSRGVKQTVLGRLWLRLCHDNLTVLCVSVLVPIKIAIGMTSLNESLQTLTS